MRSRREGPGGDGETGGAFAARQKPKKAEKAKKAKKAKKPENDAARVSREAARVSREYSGGGVQAPPVADEMPSEGGEASSARESTASGL
jgi:hypothetical protein